jgi:hypothetical protein
VVAVEGKVHAQHPIRPTVSPESILNAALGFIASKQLFVASEIGLFEQLAPGPSTLDELAARIGVPRRTLRIVADAMVALGLLDCDADRYENGAAAQAYLSGQTAGDLRPLLALWDRLSYPALWALADGVRSGQAVKGAFPEEEQQIYSAGLEALLAGPARALARTYDFSKHHRVLGLGGGIRVFLIGIADERPELAPTLQLAAADLFTDPIPAGHDAVILANVVHRMSPERNRALLRRTRESVAPGARLLLVDLWTDETRTQPLAAALLAGELLVLAGEGDVYRERDVRGWLYARGWRPLRCTSLESPWGLLVAEAV